MKQVVRLGVLRLTDSAPAILADAEGLFAQHGLEVALHIEPSWANVADKLQWGGLDAAIMLLPLALAMAAGLRGPPAKLVIPMGISRCGNSVVVSQALAADQPAPFTPSSAAAVMQAWLRSHRGPRRFAVVHMFSSHSLLLRDWLASAGIDPDRDLEIVVIPPERVVDALAAGHIAGFCAGAPWGDVAEAAGCGRILLGSSAVMPRHAEKCLALAGNWLASRPDTAAALVSALHAAQELCDQPARATGLAALLSQRLSLPFAAALAGLAGGNSIEHPSFAQADRLEVAEVVWFGRQMQRWGWMDAQQDVEALVRRLLP